MLTLSKEGNPTALEYGVPTSHYKRRERGSEVTAPGLVLEDPKSA